MPQRLNQLETWLQSSVGLSDYTIQTASGDASFRRYFRITTAQGDTLIAMDAPPEKEDSQQFVTLAHVFQETGIHVPHIHAQDLEQGFVLLDDLGTRHYLDELSANTCEGLYSDALSALMVMQACGPTELPIYDQTMLHTEMALFTDWLLHTYLNLTLSDQEKAMLNETFSYLADSALDQPQVCVHRDYHSRNLMVTPSPSPGIIDFQDAVMGPVTYDLVSLLRDCYIDWPREQVESWAKGYFDLAVQSGVMRPEHEPHFMTWFDLMGIQRHLKAAGIFARLNCRDNKANYLLDIPRTLNYIVQVGMDYDPTKALATLVKERVLPATLKICAK